jgi:hypothetical protein
MSPIEYWCRWQILLAALEWKYIYGHLDARLSLDMAFLGHKK